MRLVGFDSAAFLRDHWQKTPLLIRNPWEDWRNPLEPDELAGLACEEGVESRLVTATDDRWAVEHGPVSEKRFGKLGRKPWSLLVQAVDHHVPEVAALIEPFRFVPNWRIDDVMVSYATDGGGVGPHFDQYDVFLVQGLGRRRWRIGGLCDADTELLPHDDLRLLARFEPEAEWILEPGDILYVPPRFAHDGVALGDDCMTYSVGFRAPARSELIAHWCDALLADLADDDRYADPGLAEQANSGEITAEALASLHAMVAERLLDREAFTRWFGQYSSTPKYPEVDWRPETPIGVDSLRAKLAVRTALNRNPASRFSFIRQDGDAVLLFVDGRCYGCAAETSGFAEQICAADRIVLEPEVSDPVLALIAELIGEGGIALDDED
jgi:50S ribosomal protein L16 3-hydroxylase